MKHYFCMKYYKWDGLCRDGSWYMGLKLDGMGAIWDGGVTRHEMVNGRISTGLFSTNGNPIYFPSEYLDLLPPYPLAGELTASHFEETSSIVRCLDPDERWDRVTFNVFDRPSLHQLFKPRLVDTHACKFHWRYSDAHRVEKKVGTREFLKAYTWSPKMLDRIETNKFVRLTEWWPAHNILDTLDHAVERGYEGLVLRKSGTLWQPIKAPNVFKIKPRFDAEATVIGMVHGTGKFTGKMGSLLCEYEGRTIVINGFRDCDRELPMRTVIREGQDFTACPIAFPFGKVITFTYTGYTIDGVPENAMYLRSV